MLQGALWGDGPQNYAESSPEAKRVLCITVLPRCLAAVQQPGLECFQAKIWLEGSEDGVSPQISVHSPPSCAQLSPLSDVPLWPLTAFPSSFLATSGFPRLPGGLTALPRWGTSPLWRLSSWRGAASRARSLPRGSGRNKCPVCAGAGGQRCPPWELPRPEPPGWEQRAGEEAAAGRDSPEPGQPLSPAPLGRPDAEGSSSSK